MATISQPMRTGVRAEPIAGQKSQAILWWAGAGVFCWLLQLYIFGSWWYYGDMKRVPPGPTPVPQWMDLAQTANTWFWGAAIVVTLYWWVFKPLFKTGKMSVDGIFLLGFWAIWWQDALPNYNNLPFNYNSAMFNLGSWSCHIPGWQSPGGCLLAEPLAWDLAFYIVLSALAVIFGTRWMQSMKSRNPNMSTPKLFFNYFVAIAIGDFIVEMIWVAMGLYHYGGMPNHLSILNDTRFKFPIFEPILIGACFVGFAAFYYFRNDKGETLAERGLDQVNVSSSGKQWLRFFAFSGAINAAFFTLFSVPHILINLNGDAWPKEIQELSWYTHGLCGADTSFVCQGKNVALPRRDAINIGPNGEITMPENAQVPQLVPFKLTVD
ncbi:MAG: hypothetical protein JWQ90_2502 [Hydrocarboniphaga sp.]|uniref:spirocyclase AveC family protein n=1 Tax=Hydrocarboniphaga sp. TaxID=2033016 RepID=UPI0026256A06|nr:spirocyclase AveC family protein [Hydrocarboniphaga sp.]MDB5970052.1 hypothetical protein [Hydrocarboniphaga sp.]